jgi:hypothetical protein
VTTGGRGRACGWLGEAFPAPEAPRLAGRFGFHYTPEQDGWLNLAGSQPGVLSAQRLDRRIPDKVKQPPKTGQAV